MKNSLRLEEAMMFSFSIYLFSITDFAWWLYLVLILTPDIGMIGYLLNTKVGAFSYNLFHHKGVAIVLLLVGWQLAIPWVALSGIILFGHSSLDRVFGYGLKYSDDFKHTHLGAIGNS